MSTPTLSAQLLGTRKTEEAITLIKASKLPQRFRRGLLQVWAQEVGVTLTGTDYAAVAAPE